jgi:hypothetical protein
VRRDQAGFAIEAVIIVVVLAFVTAAGAMVVHSYNSAIEGKKDADKFRADAESDRDSWKKKATNLQGDIDARDKLLEVAREENKDLRRELDVRKASMAGLAERSPSARDYLAAPVDPGVRMQRRADAGCSTTDLSVQCTPRSLRPDHPAAAAGRPQPGPAGGERRGPGGA